MPGVPYPPYTLRQQHEYDLPTVVSLDHPKTDLFIFYHISFKMSDVGRLPLGLQMLRGAGIFQAIIAFPICLFMGFGAFRSVLEPWDFMLYYFM